jgi:hypothetical protein
MKTTFFNKTRLTLFGAALLSFSFIACEKEDNSSNTQTYNTTGSANGGQQSPPVVTTGSGTLTGTYNAQTNVWNYSINWSALTTAATLVELRGPASAGVNGSLVGGLTISVPGVTGSANGSITLTEQQEAALLARKLYYTVLTATHVTGEIRGQITATAQ